MPYSAEQTSVESQKLEDYENQFKRIISNLPASKIENVLLYAESISLLSEPDFQIKENFLRYLIQDGARGNELKEAIYAINQIDSAGEKDEELFARSAEHARKWCAERGINYNSLTEEQIQNIVRNSIKRVRAEK